MHFAILYIRTRWAEAILLLRPSRSVDRPASARDTCDVGWSIADAAAIPSPAQTQLSWRRTRTVANIGLEPIRSMTQSTIQIQPTFCRLYNAVLNLMATWASQPRPHLPLFDPVARIAFQFRVPIKFIESATANTTYLLPTTTHICWSVGCIFFNGWGRRGPYSVRWCSRLPHWAERRSCVVYGTGWNWIWVAAFNKPTTATSIYCVSTLVKSKHRWLRWKPVRQKH